jgi:error-prone DNA polymerase
MESLNKSYAELKCRSNFSFLRGASHPEELIDRAVELGLPAIAIADRDGVYGIPKAYWRAKDHPNLKLLVGAELTIAGRPHLTLLARDRKAYGVMCRMLTAAHAGKPKGEAALTLSELEAFAGEAPARGLIVLPDGVWSGTVSLRTPPAETWEGSLDRLRDWFPGNLHLPLVRVRDGLDRRRTEQTAALARDHAIPLVASNDVQYHVKPRARLHDAVTAIRNQTSVAQAGFLLNRNSERYLKSPGEMSRLYADLPDALSRTLDLAASCTFSPRELRYRYPSEWIPKPHSAQSWLEELAWKGAERRWKGRPPDSVTALIRHELKLIAKLEFADYFLTIWDIVAFARSRGILCQGRGSAANSVVCYCLEITAVDPVRLNLLFERFISEERGEPPDIDVDFEHERREEVIQYIYEKYGRDRAAMVCAVVTYRSKLSRREIEKVIPEPERAPLVEELVSELRGFPRHLSIHSGGFTLSSDALVEIVPVEPARMPGRTVVQWNKDDLAELGLLKVDILSLGMLTAIHKTLDLIGQEITDIPAEDPETYKMIQRADTVGTFQIESRAQMNMLGRLMPRTFYDLVIEVAIVRPGPILGKMVHPFLRRRRGEEPIIYPDPRAVPILQKTLGVPLFQEQIMKLAIVLAGFSPGEADELRRAIGGWRSNGSIDRMGQKLADGLRANGVAEEFAVRIMEQIKGFAVYGFPESHAASFALLAYVSAYLKCHHPAEFVCGLLNSQPMGFYANHSLVDDAKRHGVAVFPVDPRFSHWDCVMEEGGVRLGWRVVHGLNEAVARAVVSERERAPFQSLTDFLARTRLRSDTLCRIAMGNSFSCFGLDQRHALWQILAHAGKENLFSAVAPESTPELFPRLNPLERIKYDYDAYHLSTESHPMKAIRDGKFLKLPRATTAEARALKTGSRLRIAGLTLVRQRPPTANGVTFSTLEDENGFLDVVIFAKTYEKYRETFLSNSFLIMEGKIERDTHTVSFLVDHLEPMWHEPDEAPDIQARQYF